jgi:hypothetical protein
VKRLGRLGSTRRVLQFVDGASCEVEDNEALAAMLAGHAVAPSRVSDGNAAGGLRSRP